MEANLPCQACRNSAQQEVWQWKLVPYLKVLYLPGNPPTWPSACLAPICGQGLITGSLCAGFQSTLSLSGHRTYALWLLRPSWMLLARGLAACEPLPFHESDLHLSSTLPVPDTSACVASSLPRYLLSDKHSSTATCDTRQFFSTAMSIQPFSQPRLEEQPCNPLPFFAASIEEFIPCLAHPDPMTGHETAPILKMHWSRNNSRKSHELAGR